ncbi:tyrosine-type recombinase/integrase [Rhizobium sp.]
MSEYARVLTDAYIRSLKPAEKGKRYAVADAVVPGLKIRVTDRGTKSFIVWKRWGGAPNPSARALGTFGPSDGGNQLTLASARTRARDWLEMRAAGKDPKQVALQESLVEAAKKANSFESVMEAYLARHVRGHRKADQTEREIRKELLSALRERPITEVTRKDLISIIDKIVDRGANYQAHNIWGHASSLFNWAIDSDYGLAVSPCWPKKPRSLLTKEGAKKPRQRVLKESEIAAFWQASGEMGYPYGPLFQILLLTGQRKNELAGARWSEFDLVSRTLTIPPERYKSDAAHVVPLSDEVLQILASLPRWPEGDHLFSTTSGRVPVNGFSKAKQRLDAGMNVRLGTKPASFVIHDIRRTVRTGLAQAKVPEHIAELVIGHARRGLAGVYDRHSYLDERRSALRDWASRVAQLMNVMSSNSGNA